jgi:UDP-glucose 4-epimerase
VLELLRIGDALHVRSEESQGLLDAVQVAGTVIDQGNHAAKLAELASAFNSRKATRDFRANFRGLIPHLILHLVNNERFRFSAGSSAGLSEVWGIPAANFIANSLSNRPMSMKFAVKFALKCEASYSLRIASFRSFRGSGLHSRGHRVQIGDDMNVFVTGGAGYIGSVCVEELLNAGHQVTVFDNLSEGHAAAVDKRAAFVSAALQDREAIASAVRDSQAEAIIHFAANALVSESMSDPSKYFRNNVAAGVNLLDAAVAAGIRKFVFSSTCATYGLPERMPMTEDLPQRPINPYGESKLMFERILHWYHQIHGLEFVAFRYFNAAGASDQFGEHHRIETHLIPNVLRVALGQAQHCPVYGADYPTPDGTCIRDYIHVIDLAQAHILALKPGLRGFYNLGNGAGYSVREVVRTCEAVSAKAIPTVSKARRPGDPPRLVASAEKVVKELGWQPRFPKLEEIVSSAWRWHCRFPNGYPE